MSIKTKNIWWNDAVADRWEEVGVYTMKKITM